MGLFSSLFGGGAKKAEEVNDANAQALKQFFKENLPSEFVNSAKYAISITRGDKGYEARINMDMGADGSTCHHEPGPSACQVKMYLILERNDSNGTILSTGN